MTRIDKYHRELLRRPRTPGGYGGMWLGGSSGSAGGSGGPPGGFVGCLRQNKVCYDTTEAESSSGSTSLLNNLDHIRKRVADLEDAGGVGDFLSLSDTPASYSGQALSIPRVNSGENALEFQSVNAILKGYDENGTFAGGQTASGDDSVAIGDGPVASGYSSIALGNNVTSSGSYTTSIGKDSEATLRGQFAHSAGDVEGAGLAQTSVYVLRRTVTHDDDAWYELYLDGVGEQLVVPDNTTWLYSALILGTGDGHETLGYRVEGVIIRYDGTTIYSGASLPTVVIYENIASYTAGGDVDYTNYALKIVVKDASSLGSTIHWLARVTTVEISGFEP